MVPFSISLCGWRWEGLQITSASGLEAIAWNLCLPAESHFWLDFSWFMALIGCRSGHKLCSSESSFPPVGQVQSPGPWALSWLVFHRAGRSLSNPVSDQNLQRIFLSLPPSLDVAHLFFYTSSPPTFSYLPFNSSFSSHFPSLKIGHEELS